MKIHNIGDKIRHLREEKKITQKELGNFLGYSESFISYVEKGERSLSAIDLNKLTNFFDVSYDFINTPVSNGINFRTQTKQKENVDFEKMLKDFEEHAKTQLT